MSRATSVHVVLPCDETSPPLLCLVTSSGWDTMKKRANYRLHECMSSCVHGIFIGSWTYFQEVGLSWRTLTLTFSTLSLRTRYFPGNDNFYICTVLYLFHGSKQDFFDIPIICKAYILSKRRYNGRLKSQHSCFLPFGQHKSSITAIWP